MAQLFDANDIINIVNAEEKNLGFFLIEINHRTTGYEICACYDEVVGGHNVLVIFRRDILHLSRYYSRDEVGHLIQVLSTIYKNIKMPDGDN